MANRIAEAFIELKVRGEQATKRAIENVKKSAKGMGDGFDKALGGVGERLDKATEGARKLQGAIAGVLGIVSIVAVAFYKFGNALFDFSQKFGSAKGRVDEFRQTLRESGKDASDQADLVRQRIAELTETLEQISRTQQESTITPPTDAFVVRRYREELEELNRVLTDLNAVEQARSARNLSAQQEAARKLVELQNEALRTQIEANAVALEADPIKQAELRRAQQIRDLNNEILDAQRRLADAQEDNDLNTAARLRERISLLQLIGKQTNDLVNAEVEALKKLGETTETVTEGIKEAGVDVARVIAEANTQAAAQTRQALLDAVSAINSQGPAFSQLEDLVASIADSVQQMKGRL